MQRTKGSFPGPGCSQSKKTPWCSQGSRGRYAGWNTVTRETWPVTTQWSQTEATPYRVSMDDSGQKFAFCSKHSEKSFQESKQWRDIIHVFKRSLWMLYGKMNQKGNKNERRANSWEAIAVGDARAQFPWLPPLTGTRVVAMQTERSKEI